ncbi:MAG TPA: type VI secretion system contractile sheath large subunit [Acidobacteriota bacterium]|nr:type VI secretion system contractile sheath large subunit [Acidobacteriota bacterium]
MSAESQNRRDRIRFGSSDREEVPAEPLRLLAVGEFSSTSERARAGPVSIDKDSFNEVLRSFCPAVSFYIEDRTSSSQNPIPVKFVVQDLKSFHPAGLCQMDALSGLLRDRQAVLDLRDGRSSLEEFRNRARTVSSFFQEQLLKPVPEGARAVPSTGGSRSQPLPDQKREDALDAILGMVDAPEGITTAPSSTEGARRVQAFLADMFKGSRPSAVVNRSEADRVVKEIDAILANRLNDVVGDPEFRRLESAWRGLKFLIDRTDFRDPIRIELVAAEKKQLPILLEEMVSNAGPFESGFDVILADFDFGNTPEDHAVLRRVGELAMELRTPVVSNVGPAFFSKSDLAEVLRIPLFRSYMESEPFVKWDSFRGTEASRWVAVGLNRFLLRNRYAEGGARTPFAFEEAGDGLWGSPAWAIGSLLVRSFSRSGWCGHITGMRGGGIIEDLPVRPFALAGGEVRQIPLEGTFRKSSEGDFYDAGFLALQCAGDQDVAVLLEAPMVHRPERYPDSRDTEYSRQRAKLVYQLVTGRIVRYVESLLAESRWQTPAEIQGGLASALERWIGSGSVVVKLADSQERSGYFDLMIRIEPGASIWSLQVPVEMNIPLRKP